MTTSDPGEGEPTTQSEAAARAQRLAALRGLAGERLGEHVEAPRQPGGAPTQSTAPAQQKMQATATTAPARKRRSRGWVWGAVLAVLVIAVIAVGALRFGPALAQQLTAKKEQPPITVLSITPRYDGDQCFSDAVWSPKGDQIALLGYQNGCTGFDTQGSSPGVVNVYSAVTGRFVTQFPLDTLLHHARIIQQSNQFIQYGSVAWAANGQTLAVSFLLGSENNTINPIQYSQTGLLLINVVSGHTQVFLYSSSKGYEVTGAIVWDIATGKAIPTPSLDPLRSVAYQWGAKGQLLPLAKAPSNAVGAPLGGQSFTIWQPGALIVVLQQPDPSNPTALKPVPGAYIWSNNFIAWSPDGNYLYAALGSFNNLALPNTQPPSAKQLDQAGFGPLQTIAPHDQALTNLYPQLLQQIPTEIQNDQQGFPETDVGWSPDGRLLASQPLLASSSSNEYTVTLYDTTTGNIVKKLTHDTKLSGVSDNFSSRLLWSPDGKRLALASNTFGTLTIWTFNKPLE